MFYLQIIKFFWLHTDDCYKLMSWSLITLFSIQTKAGQLFSKYLGDIGSNVLKNPGKWLDYFGILLVL